MGDRGLNRHGPKTGGLLCPFRRELGLRLVQCGGVAWAEVYFRTKWYGNRPHPSSRLATIDMGQKLGGVGVPFFLGELGPHRTQSCLGRGLPPYQAAS